jgi:hypothetical protein
VIPSTLLGLVVFAASLGPGYIFVLIAERRHPRHERSQLLELAELVVIGALASTAAALVVLWFSDAKGWIDTARLAAEGGRYLIAEPHRGLGAFLAILVLSYVGAGGAARIIYRHKSELVRASMWHTVLEQTTTENLAFATVELTDRRVISGYVHSYSVRPGAPEETYLALQRPIFVGPAMAVDRELLRDDYLMIRGDKITYVGVQFHPPVS